MPVKFDQYNKSLKDKFSPFANKVKLNKRNKIWIISGAVCFIFFISVSFILKQNEKKEAQEQAAQIEKAAKFTSITADFSDEDTRSELHTEQSSVDDVKTQLSSVEDQLKETQKALADAENTQKEQQDAQAKTIADLRDSMGGAIGKGTPSADNVNSYNGIHLTSEQANSNLNAFDTSNQTTQGQYSNLQVEPQLVGGMQRFDFAWNNEGSSNDAEQAYVPMGTYVDAIVTGGADANASVTGQSNTEPVFFRITSNGVEPNDKKAPLKDCVVMGEVYGDISSERGEVRLNRLSCNKADGTVLDIPVKGVAFDNSGKEGIRGIPVMRNGKMLFLTGTAGAVGSGAQTAQAAQTTQSVNPLGSTTTVPDGGAALRYSAFGGAAAAANTLAKYYIQLAEQYHPIIEINPGSETDLVFQEGFSLKSVIQQTMDNPTATNNQSAVQQVISATDKSNGNQNNDETNQTSNGESGT